MLNFNMPLPTIPVATLTDKNWGNFIDMRDQAELNRPNFKASKVRKVDSQIFEFRFMNDVVIYNKNIKVIKIFRFKMKVPA